MKHYLYHVTKPENVPAILRDGLKRKYEFAVYLSEKWDSWWKPRGFGTGRQARWGSVLRCCHWSWW